LSEVKQNRAALEDREIAIGQPRHLAEWLVREMLRLSIAKRHARDTIGQAGLFQRPAHTQIAYKTPRQFGNPIEGGQSQFGHPASPCAGSSKGRVKGSRSDISGKFFRQRRPTAWGGLALV
jgi:hypothetical protein